MKSVRRRAGICVIAAFLVGISVEIAGAAELQPGEYACAGSGGRILIGLGFKLLADGTYTDLDGKTSGGVVDRRSTGSLVGGRLAGHVGHNSRGANCEIVSIRCSRN